MKATTNVPPLNVNDLLSVMEVSPNGVGILHTIRDERGQVVDFVLATGNSNLVAFFGLPRPVEGMRLSDLADDCLLAAAVSLYEQALQSGALIEQELGEFSQGRARWFRLRVKPLSDSDGVVISYTDITRRVEADETQRAFLTDMRALHDIHLELTVVDDMTELYHQMIALARDRLNIDRIGLFVVSDDRQTMYGTYGIDAVGNVRPEYHLIDDITPDHWTRVIDRSPGHVHLWQDASLYEDRQIVGKGWIVGAALWSRNRAIGYLSVDNLLTGKPFRPYEAELIALLGSIYGHLLERKRAEADLRQSEMRYRALFEQSNDGVYILDLNGEILFSNQRAADMLGYTPEEMRHLRRDEIIAPEHRSNAHQVIERLLAGETIAPYERQFIRKDGERLPVEISARLVRDETGAPLHFQNIVRDISERVTNRMYLEAVLNSSVNGIMAFRSVRDETGAILDFEWTLVNKAAEAMTGRTADYLIGRLLTEEMPGNRTEGLFDHYVQVVENGVPLNLEHHYKHDNIVSWFHTVALKMGDGFVVTFADITERVDAQARAFRAALERERMELLTNFIQNTAHEFRTPLAIINSGAYLMTRNNDPAYCQQKADQIGEQVARITRLVDSLLKMSRLESEGVGHMQPLRVDQLADDKCERARAVYPQGPRISSAHPAHPLYVNANADSLSEAIHHLIENACRYTPPEGTVKVSVFQREDSHVVIEVADTGIGIDPDFLPRIFETFWRRDYAHTTPGLGLGLSIVRRIIELHGGSVGVSSVVGEGSQFRIVLPCVTEGAYSA